MVTKTRASQELNPVVVQQVTNILEETEREKETKGYWYFQMPSPGVRVYSFDPPGIHKATKAR